MMLPPLYMIRHGLTQTNIDGLVCGSGTDVTLIEEGITQAKESAEFVQSLRVKKVYCSPMIRTRQTLEALGLPEDIEVVFDERLVEFHFGDNEGKLLEDVPPEDLSMTQRVASPDKSFSGSETITQIRARINSLLEELSQSAEPTLLVSHGGTLRLMFMQLCPQRQQELIEMWILNASVWGYQDEKLEMLFAPEEYTDGLKGKA